MGYVNYNKQLYLNYLLKFYLLYYIFLLYLYLSLFIFIFKGPSWGKNGYILVARSSANLCGLLDYGSYPSY